jgi:hypothetical protein
MARSFAIVEAEPEVKVKASFWFDLVATSNPAVPDISYQSSPPYADVLLVQFCVQIPLEGTIPIHPSIAELPVESARAPSEVHEVGHPDPLFVPSVTVASGATVNINK